MSVSSVSSVSSPASPRELFTASHSLASQAAAAAKSTTTIQPTNPTIPIKILSTAVPQVITTTKTLRRCCGFSLALIGFVFYCLRAFVLLWWMLYRLFGSATESKTQDNTIFVFLESFACSVGIFQFLSIMKTPKLTLKDTNFKNVWMFLLVPSASLLGRFLHSPVTESSYILPAFELIFFSGYIYGLSLNGRSSSLWAGFKPYRYEMVPLILPIPPSSRAFPQYTVPVEKYQVV